MKKFSCIASIAVVILLATTLAMANGYQEVTIYNGGSNYVGVAVTGVPGVTVVNTQNNISQASQGVVVNGNYFPVASEFNYSGAEVAGRVGNSHSGAYADISNDWNFVAGASNQGAGASLSSNSNGFTYTEHAAGAQGNGYNYSQANLPGIEMDSFTGGNVASLGNANANYSSSSNINVTIW